MARKKTWIMFASILSVVLMVATSLGAAIDADVNTEGLVDDSGINAESGRIGLDEKAEAEIATELDSFSSSDEDIIILETESNPGEDDPSAPLVNDEEDPSASSDDLIWLAVDGDEILDDDSGNSDLNSDGSGGIIDTTLNTVMIGSTPQSPAEVDEVFVASDSGIVDKEISINSNLPIQLNILGRAEIEVLDGSENLIEQPHFEGLDVFDRISLTFASASVMFIIRAVQLLDVAFPLVDSIIIASTICSWILDGAISVIQNGLEFIFENINIGLSITIGDHTYTLPGIIREAIKNLILNILSGLDSTFGELYEKLQDYAEQSKENLINYILDLKEFFTDPDFKTLVGQLYTGAPAAVGAILLVLQSKDTTKLEEYFDEVCGLTDNQIDGLISALNQMDHLFVGIRDGIFGKFDLFATYGRSATSLRNLHAKVRPDYQPVGGGYAAVIKIKAISAGQVFDSKIIGIIFDGNDNGTLDSSENLYTSEGSTVSGSTMSGSTSFGSTVMDGTTQTSGLQ